MVSMTADGASVNFGQYRGLLTRMSNDDRDWLLKIHCVCHRLELAIKDSLLKNKVVCCKGFHVNPVLFIQTVRQSKSPL